MAVISGNNNNRRFFDIYEEHVDLIQRKMVEYIKTLQPSAKEQQKKSRPDLIISTKEGYPWMPQPPEEEGIEQKKQELETLIRTYLNFHYSE